MIIWLMLAGVALAVVRWRVKRRFRKSEIVNVTEGRTRPERGGF